MLAYDMNYPNMTTAGMQSSSASISLPPISSIDFRVQHAHHSPPEVVQPLPPPPPPPPRYLPPIGYHNGGRQIPQEPQYVQQRHMYTGMQVPSPYAFGPGTRVPLPSTTDPSLIVAPARHKTKEVKRRTKTGCLTCRKRRIKCDEGRPECRNCMKSKRQCMGYDPVFQSQAPHSLHPTPTSTSSSNSTTATASSVSQPRRYTVTPSSPSTSNHTASLPNTSPRDPSDFSFSKPPDLLPHINQPYKMDHTGHGGLPSYTSASRPRHSIEEICTIAGTKLPSIPAIPPDSVPNLDSIRKVYDIAFAPGLDKFLESSQHWFSREGFDLLASKRPLLGLVLAYLTLVSANHDAPLDSNDTLASQEARVTWGLLSLCVRPDHHGDAEADKLARRFRILESILTGEALTSTATSMSEFVHQDDPDPETESSLDAKEEETKRTTFEKQVSRRTEEFWKTLETIAIIQSHAQETSDEIKFRVLPQLRSLLDGRESRDIIYSTVMLGFGGSSGGGGGGGGGGGAAGETCGNGRDRRDGPSSERELARRFLMGEAGGRATQLVGKTMAGMGLRAFDC